MRGDKTVDQVFVDNGVPTGKYLLVTMAFNPNSNATVAPSLTAWRQIYDCVPGQ